MPEPTLISLGSINLDVQMRTDRWPDPGETLLGGDFLMTAGGKAANVAALARRLGAKVTLIGHVGDDPLADIALGQLREDGIDLRHVGRVPDTPTAVSTIFTRPDGDKTIILAPNANLVWDAARDAGTVSDIIASAPEGSALVTDLEIPVPIVQRAMEAARERAFPIVLDPSPADRFTDEFGTLASVLTPNTAEASTLAGIEIDSDEAAERAGGALVERGVAAVCQKLGDGGCLVVTGDGVTPIPPVPVEVVDTTGAGDAFAGGMGVALLEGRELLDVATMAVAASHIAVTGYGSRQSYPFREELDEMAQRIDGAREMRTRDT